MSAASVQEFTMARHGLTDEQWSRLEHLFPTRTGGPGRPPVDQRRVVDAILWVLRTGAPWRDLPEEFGKWQTVYTYFAKWRDDGTFQAVQDFLQSELLALEKLQNDLWSVDGTNIRATRAAVGGGKKERAEEPADHALGRSRGGFGTKVHLLVDASGVPLGFHLTAGQAHELTGLEALLDPDDATPLLHLVEPAALAGDKGYSANWVRERIAAVGWRPVIPTRSNEHRVCNDAFDPRLYKRRNVVERCVGWLKECRRIATRYEKLAVSYAAMLTLACVQRYLRVLS